MVNGTVNEVINNLQSNLILRSLALALLFSLKHSFIILFDTRPSFLFFEIMLPELAV